jgi:hypothetical protein
MEPGQKAFVDHFQEQIVRQCVNRTLEVASGNQTISEAFSGTLKGIPLKAIAAYVANHIGALYGEGKIDYVGHKVAHAVAGGISGWLMDSTRDGLVSGAMGAVTAEMVGEALISDAHEIADKVVGKLKQDGAPLTEKNINKGIKKELQHRADIAKVIAGGAAALTGQNASIAIETATNAVENNFLPFAAAMAAPEIYGIVCSTALVIGTAIAQKDTADALEKAEKSREAKRQAEAIGTSGATPPDPDWEPENKNNFEKTKSRSKNNLKPDQNSTTEHTTFRTNEDGVVIKYETYEPNVNNPSGFDVVKRVDLKGKTHFNKVTGQEVPTPHVHGRNIPGDVRPASPSEIPTPFIKQGVQ